jgi:dolichol kinase
MHWQLENVPWARVGLYLLLSTVVLGNVGSWLRGRGWRDGYTRKLGHFGHMVISTPLLAFLPPEQLIPGVGIGAAGVVVMYALGAVAPSPLLRGITAGMLRTRDAPRERFFLFLPLITGNVALVAAVLAFPIEAVRVGFFTVAFGDGLAEPVGLKFGASNTYRVKDLIWRSYNTKSIAGSCAVFVSALVIAVATLWASAPPTLASALVGLTFALLVTALEAVAPRGLDNMLMLILCPPILIGLKCVLHG